MPAGEHTIVGSINGDVLYDAAIVYDTGITDPETGKKVRFVAPLSIAALEEAQRTGSVHIAEPHRPMVDQAIGKVRAERLVAQEREAQRLRDEIMRQAQEQKQSPVHGRSR
jgi:hypothetical protein